MSLPPPATNIPQQVSHPTLSLAGRTRGRVAQRAPAHVWPCLQHFLNMAKSNRSLAELVQGNPSSNRGAIGPLRPRYKGGGPGAF